MILAGQRDMTDEKRLSIFFIDGSDMVLQVPPQGGNPLLLAKRIQESLDANQFVAEVDGKLVMVPKSNVKYMELEPLPDELPETVIRGARLQGGS